MDDGPRHWQSAFQRRRQPAPGRNFLLTAAKPLLYAFASKPGCIPPGEPTNLPMKRILLSFAACLSLAASASAGHEMATSGKDYKNPVPPCFQDQELQLDVFGLYGWTAQGNHDDGFGGGLGVNYFFLRNLGVGIDGSLRDADPESWTASVSLIVRFPIEGDSLCLAPYLLAGGGLQWGFANPDGEFHAGGGLEFRCPQGFGVFAEGRYYWAGHNDQIQARVGFRVLF